MLCFFVMIFFRRKVDTVFGEKLRKRGNLLCAAAVTAALGLSVLAGWTAIPLGIPGEWVWPRREIRFDGIVFLYLCLLPLFVACGGVAWWAASRLTTGRRKAAWLVAAGILAAGIFVSVEILDSGPGQRGENIMAFLDAFTGGYLTEAVHVERPVPYFSGYAARLAADEDPGNHLDVHPPGNVFFAWVVLESIRGLPISPLVDRLLLSEEIRVNLAELSRLQAFRGLPDDPAVFPAAAALLGLSIGAICLGLLFSLLAAMILRRRSFSAAGIIFGAFFAVYGCGGPILFAGHFDTFMFFLGALASLVLALALTARHSVSRCFLAFVFGVILAGAVSCTLAFGAMILLGAVCFWGRGRHFREKISPVLFLVVGGLLPVAGLWLLFDLNLTECVWLASRNNAAFFQETGRSVVAWWPYNLLDVILFSGPALLMFMIGGVHLPRRSGPRWIFRPTPAVLFVTSAAGISVLLLISPFSRGELGRLFLFFVPCCLVGALMSVDVFLRTGTGRLLLYAALLANLFLVLVLRVSLKLVIGY